MFLNNILPNSAEYNEKSSFALNMRVNENKFYLIYSEFSDSEILLSTSFTKKYLFIFIFLLAPPRRFPWLIL